MAYTPEPTAAWLQADPTRSVWRHMLSASRTGYVIRYLAETEEYEAEYEVEWWVNRELIETAGFDTLEEAIAWTDEEREVEQ